MGRPTKSLIMARKSAEILLASIEIGNKIQVPYREESFFLLLVNAWEVLLKARILQLNNNKLDSIYRKYVNDQTASDSHTNLPHTITFTESLNRVDITNDTRLNLQGISAVRNGIAHLGKLTEHSRITIFQFSNASIRNFCHLYEQWFLESIRIPHFIPVAFVGSMDLIAPRKENSGQKKLLNYLSSLCESADSKDPSYSVTLNTSVNLNPIFQGGGTIGVTNNPNAPRVYIDDNQMKEMYPSTYNDVVSQCRNRYQNFKQNKTFHSNMKKVKNDPVCAFERKLNPNNNNSSGQWFYSLEATLKILDEIYR